MEVSRTLLATVCQSVKRWFCHLYREHPAETYFIGCIVVLMAVCAAGLCQAGERHAGRSFLQRSMSAGTGFARAPETASGGELQAGLKGLAKGAATMGSYLRAAQAIDTESANGHLIIGTARVSRKAAIRGALEDGTRAARTLSESATRLVRETQMPQSEYFTLLRIVEAEATGEDLYGKMLIANVILNRVADARFPNTIEEVVWQKTGSTAQFQPTVDGRMYAVEITGDTIEAVDRVLQGEDHSEGALYFMARKSSDSASVGWFDKNLSLLFTHGGHEYYTLSKEETAS